MDWHALWKLAPDIGYFVVLCGAVECILFGMRYGRKERK